jgi:hypothetical protein
MEEMLEALSLIGIIAAGTIIIHRIITIAVQLIQER